MSEGELPPKGHAYVIATIEQRHPSAYWERMHRLVLHWLALVAMVLMPFAMASAPAAAPAAGHGMEAGMTDGHCSGEQPADEGTEMTDGCAMPCASALPAMERPASEPATVSAAIAVPVQRTLLGVETEIATPPPRRS